MYYQLHYTTPILNQTINSELSQPNDKVYKLTGTKLVAFKMNLQQCYHFIDLTVNMTCSFITGL